MTPGFSVKFVINRITGNYKIQITDTTGYSGVSTAYGFYRIEYPDGIYVENTDPQNPDFEIGQNFSEFNLRLKNSLTMAGQYRIIQKTTTDSDEIETIKVISFSFVEPELKLTNTSNLAVPNVTFTDSTNYNLGFYTEDITRLIVSNFPTTLPFSSTVVTSIGSVLNMVYSGSYYEGVYNPNLSASVVFTGTSHVVEWTKSASFSFDVRKLLTYTELISYLDVAKARYDQAKGTTNESKERENYQLVASLIDHIQFKAASTSQGISELMFEVQDLIYKITCTYTDTYTYSTSPLTPIDDQFFTEGVPFSRTLTINGVSYDLTQDRTWNVGTVTSVNIQVPTWMTVSGGPITQSGAFQLGLAAGYYIPTTADVARWDIETYVTSVSVTGTSTKTISLTRNDGVVLTAQWNDIDTFPVTSVNGKTGDVVLVTDDIAEDASPVNLWFTQARSRNSISLTTTGNSGAATYSPSTGVFNIPSYTLDGLGGVPLTRTITINGQTFDLSQDRTYTVDIGVASLSGTFPIVLSGSTGAITISHADSGVTPGTYNSFTVDVKGHITSASNQLTGHVIQNNGAVMNQRTNLNFIRMNVQDDLANNATNVTRPASVTISLAPPTANILEGDEWINSETWSKYAWYDGYWVQVNKKCGVGAGGAKTFLDLTDSPSSYSGQSLKAVRVNTAETGLEFFTVSSSKWTDIGLDIYRNSKVLVGATTFSDTTSKLEVSGRVSQVGLGNSTYFGFEAGLNDDLSGNLNAAFGHQALKFVVGSSFGYQNSAFGAFAGLKTTSGYDNTFIGRSSGQENTTGAFNTSVGSAALLFNSVGLANTAVGWGALINGTNSHNTGLGFQSLLQLTTGVQNTALGSRSLEDITTQNNNIGIGYLVGKFRSSMSETILIGGSAVPLANGQSNQIVIAHNGVGLGSNTTVIGNSSTVFGRWWGNLLLGTSTNSGDRLRVDGTVRLDTVTSATGDIVTIDENNVLRRQTVAQIGTQIGGGGSSFSGTVNRISKFTGTGTTIGDSRLIDDGTSAYFSNQTTSTHFGQNAGSSSDLVNRGNAAFGQNSGSNNATGTNWVAVGRNSGFSNVNGASWTAIGADAGYNNTAGQWVAIGYYAARASITASHFVAIGENSAPNVQTGFNWIVIGNSAAGSYSGGSTPATNIGNGSIYIGHSTKVFQGSDNEIAIGYLAEGLGSNTTSIGNSVTTLTKLFGTLRIGGLLGSPVGAVTNVGIDTEGNIVAGTGGGGLAGSGTLNRVAKFTPNGTTLGDSRLIDDGLSAYFSNQNTSTHFGFEAGKLDDLTSNGNTSFGYLAGQSNVSGDSFVAIGREAGRNATQGSWVAVGANSALTIVTGIAWTAIGTDAARNKTSGDSWVAVGTRAAADNLTGGSFVAIGENAATFYSGGSDPATSFSNGVYIGRVSKVGGAGATNEIVIGYLAEGLGSNTTVIGNSSTTLTRLFGRLRIGSLFSPAVGAVTNIGIDTNGNIVAGTSGGSALSAVPLSYTSEYLMVVGASQSSQIANQLYYDGYSFYRYKGSGTGVIANYDLVGKLKPQWRLVPNDANTRFFVSMCYGNGKFVAVSSNSDSTANRIAVSSDGVNWKYYSSAVTSIHQQVAYGNGIFVGTIFFNVAQNAQRIVTSYDGINWVARSTPADSLSLGPIIFADGKFVALTNNGQAYSFVSTDGINWTQSSAIGTGITNFTDIAYGNDLFVACSQASFNPTESPFMTSIDGLNWTMGTAYLGFTFNSIAFGKGMFVSCRSSEGNFFARSTDGVNWTTITLPGGIQNGHGSVVYGNGKFIAVSASDENVSGSFTNSIFSDDGITWQTMYGGAKTGYIAICYGNGLFVGVGPSANKFRLYGDLIREQGENQDIFEVLRKVPNYNPTTIQYLTHNNSGGFTWI